MKRPALRIFRGTPSRKKAAEEAAPAGATPPDGDSKTGPVSQLPALHCRWCGQDHAPVPLRRGQRALCVRCRSVLARKSWIGADGLLAFTVTGLIFAIPAMLMPLATFSKFGNQHASYLLTGIVALWHNGMSLLAVWTALCGVVTPILLLGVLAGHALPGRLGWGRNDDHSLAHAARALEHWAMPEVYILAVLVSFVKLGSLVNVTVGPGLWCYGAMSMAILCAWRSFELEPSHETAIPAGAEVPR